MLVPGLEKQVGVRTFKAYQALEWLENNIKDKDPDFYDQSSLEDSFDILKNECSISKIWIAMLTINTNKIGNQFGPSTSIIDCMQDVSIPSNSSRILRQFLDISSHSYQRNSEMSTVCLIHKLKLVNL